MTLSLPGGAEPLLFVLLALALDAYVGDLSSLGRVLPAPATLVKRLAVRLDRKLNRSRRGETARIVRGLLATATIVGAAGLCGWLVAEAVRAEPVLWPVEFYLVLSAVTVRGPWMRARAVAAALGDGGLAAGREAVRGLTFRRVRDLDVHGVVRVTIESLARTIDGRIVSPIFWYLLLGLPGLLSWVAVDALARVIGHPTPRHAAFGLAAARLRTAFGFLPGRLAALTVVIAAIAVGTASPFGGLRTAFSRRGWASSAPVDAAVAGALDLALGGPRRDGRAVIRQPWIGTGRARAKAADLKRALALYAVACTLIGIAVATASAAVILVAT